MRGCEIDRCNGHGVWIRAGADEERLRNVRVYAESGSVQLWVEVRPLAGRGDDVEALQYLTSQQARAVGMAFLRAAVVSAWQRLRRG